MLAQTLASRLSSYQTALTTATASPEIQKALSEFRYGPEKIQAGQAELQATIHAKAAQEKEKGEAQAATQNRDLALEALEDWMDDFLDIAQVALAEQVQLSEILGLKQLS